MTVSILQDKVILRPEDIQPLNPEFNVVGTFNPAATRYGGDIILLVRVVEQPGLKNTNQLVSPRAVWKNDRLEWRLDSFDTGNVDTRDPRFFRLPNGRVRLRYISHLRLARLNAATLEVQDVQILPDLLPREEWEEFGIEDARITQIDDVYYITYVAISRKMGIATALMTTRDFQSYRRHGIIFPTENKDVVLLPQKINRKFLALHRPVSSHWVDAPSIEIAISPDAVAWGGHKFLMGPGPGDWEAVKIGAGPPPVKLPQGWLLVYHGVSTPSEQSPGGVYCAGAVLLDLDNPSHVIARSSSPILCPDRHHEQNGFLPNIVFPTGALLSDDRKNLLLFTGAADEVTANLTIPVQSILDHLEIQSRNETSTLSK